MAKILVVEDDADVAASIVDWLSLEKHTLEQVHDGHEAFDRVRCYDYELIILDWDLPGVKGIDVLRDYRREGGLVPILMLTGHSSVDEREMGLDTGADDYLTKPFHMKELSARVRALLRRATTTDLKERENLLKVADLEFNTKTLQVTRSNRHVHLLPRESALLEFLMRHKGQFFTAEVLLNRVWSSESEASPDALRQCVTRLRKKIHGEGLPELLQNVPRAGYKIDEPAEKSE